MLPRGPEYSGSPVSNADLRKDIIDVAFDCVITNGELHGNLLIAVALGNEYEDLILLGS
jgi:hypothetical protein